MSKRAELIKKQLADGKQVNFDSLKVDDTLSLEGVLNKEKINLNNYTKSVNNYLCNPDMTLGEEFIELFGQQEASAKRIVLIEEVIEKYV